MTIVYATISVVVASVVVSPVVVAPVVVTTHHGRVAWLITKGMLAWPNPHQNSGQSQSVPAPVSWSINPGESVDIIGLSPEQSTIVSRQRLSATEARASPTTSNVRTPTHTSQWQRHGKKEQKAAQNKQKNELNKKARKNHK